MNENTAGPRSESEVADPLKAMTKAAPVAAPRRCLCRLQSPTCRNRSCNGNGNGDGNTTNKNANKNAGQVNRGASCLAVVKNFMLMATRSFALNPLLWGRTHVELSVGWRVYVCGCVLNGVIVLPYFGRTFMLRSLFPFTLPCKFNFSMCTRGECG